MKSIVKFDRIMWTLAIGAAMASAVASGDKNQQNNPKPPPPPAPQQRSEAPRQAFQPPAQQQRSEAPRQVFQPPAQQQRSETPRQVFQPPAQQQRSEAPRQAFQPPAQQQRSEAPRQAFQPPTQQPRAVEPVRTPRSAPQHSTDPAPNQPRAFAPHQVPRDAAPTVVDRTPRPIAPRQTNPNPTPFAPRSDTLSPNPRGSRNFPPSTSAKNGSFHTGDPGQAGQSWQGQGQGRNQGNQSHGTQGQSNANRGNSSDSARSGHADYRGSNNKFTGRDSRPYWSPPPAVSVSQYRAQQLRDVRNAHTVYGDHARRGYIGYKREARDSSFRYPFYVFDPYATFGCVSPWYFYPSLPGYIDPNRCSFLSAGLLPPRFLGLEYTWYRQGYDQGYQDAHQGDQQTDQQPADNRILDGALDDIVATFKNDDQRSLDRLVAETGNVNIYVDGRYSYSLATNDFYDLIRDNAHTTQTVDYQILDVKVNGDEAKVIALHTFKDPWGDSEQVYHTYTLKVGQRSAQITEYGTSATRPG